MSYFTKQNKNPLQETYACYAKLSSEHRTSSSGGAFSVFARTMLDCGGIVCGAAFDDSQKVAHILIKKADDLSKVKGTKYVQSTIGDVYCQIRELLNQEQKVLFSGTPCQIAGLKSFLGKEYSNLLTIDLICHGVPSPMIWEKYLLEMGEAYGEKIIKTTFRNKNDGINQVTVDYYTESGRLIREKYSECLYIKGFIQNLFVRPSCFICPFKGVKRCSDITLGDFWGAKEYHKKLENDQGVSMMMIHSLLGKKWLKKCWNDFIIESSKVKYAALWNESLLEPTKPSPNRDHFFKEVYTVSVSKAIAENLILQDSSVQIKSKKSDGGEKKSRLIKWIKQFHLNL